MNKIDKLINVLCPNGVEFKTIENIAIIKRGRVISKQYLNSNKGEYPVYSSQTSNNGIIGNINTYDYEGDYVTWTTDGAYAGTVFYRNGKFSITNICGLLEVKDKSILSTKYLSYVLGVNTKRHVKDGSGNPKLMSNIMASIRVPIPPIEVQNEIVNILDKFVELEVELEAELQAELEARKVQYEFYRERMFETESNYICLGDLGKVCMCKRIMKNETSPEGDIPFYKIGTFGQKADSYITKDRFLEYKRKYSYPKVGDILVSCSGTIGRSVVFDGHDSYYQDSNIVWLDNDEKKVLNKFLYYFYQTSPWRVADGGTIKRLYNSNFASAKVPLYSLEKQKHIVEILDKFDKLINDISKGLPAEIKMRREQYEYYRDRLLSFEEVSV